MPGYHVRHTNRNAHDHIAARTTAGRRARCSEPREFHASRECASVSAQRPMALPVLLHPANGLPRGSPLAPGMIPPSPQTRSRHSFDAALRNPHGQFQAPSEHVVTHLAAPFSAPDPRPLIGSHPAPPGYAWHSVPFVCEILFHGSSHDGSSHWGGLIGTYDAGCPHPRLDRCAQSHGHGIVHRSR